MMRALFSHDLESRTPTHPFQSLDVSLSYSSLINEVVEI